MNKINVNGVFSQDEIDLMDAYVVNYGYDRSVIDDSNRRPFLSLLDEEWAHEKYPFYKAFGDKLIISKEVEIGMDIDEMSSVLSAKRNTPDNPIDLFYNHCYKYFCMLSTTNYEPFTYRGWSYNSVVEWAYYNLLDNYTLLKNVVPEGETVIVSADETHKEFKIQPGCKVMKALRKIAERYNIEGFEELCLEHSKILNTPKRKEEMYISIHPLDFITMSENDSNWTSCMNWHQTGCYRMGTIEMMNSPMVVVAYIKGEQDMIRFGKTWNNKKWRQLFVVVDEAIIGIKGYPYRSESSAKEAIKILADIFPTAEYDMSNFDTYEYDCDKFFNDRNPWDKGIKIGLETNSMYNDFGTTYHDIVFNKTTFAQISDGSFDGVWYNYSGLDQCLICGRSVASEWDDYDYDDVPCEKLVCNRCEPAMAFCEVCGERYLAEETRTFADGTACCPNCFAHKGRIDILTNERYGPNNNDIIDITVTSGEYSSQHHWEYFTIYTHRDNLRNGSWGKVFPEIKDNGSYWNCIKWIDINQCSELARAKITQQLPRRYDSIEDFIKGIEDGHGSSIFF